MTHSRSHHRSSSPLAAGRRPTPKRRRAMLFEALEGRSLLATIPYLVPAGTAGNQNFGGSLGMDFNVNSPITVTSLGAFDSNSDGINGTINVRIYDRTSPAVPLATAVFTGAGQPLVGGSRFSAIAALNLPTGFQGRIVADGYNGAELNGNGGPWTTDSGGGALTFVGGGFFDGAAGVYPNIGDGGPANRYAAGTFLFGSTTLTTTYVDDSWAAFTPGQIIPDADAGTTGNQLGIFGADAFPTIGGALAAVSANGTTIVNGGTYPEAVIMGGTQSIEVTGPNAAQAVVINSLTTAIGQNVILEGTSTLTLGNGVNTTIAGNLSGSGNLIKTGASVVTLAGVNTYTGTTTVNQGTLTFTQVGPGSNNGNIGAGANTQLTTSAVTVAAGAVVNFNTASNFSSSNTGTTLTGAGTIRLSSGVWWMGNAGGGTTIAMSPGALIDVQAGTIKNDYASANWGANQSNLNVAAGAFFNLRNNNVSVATLTGAGSVFNDYATNTLTIGVANGTGGTFTGTMGVVGFNVIKTGTGTQTLSGAAINYTGTTAVNVGQLVLFNTNVYNSPTTVASGATLTWSGNNNMQNNNAGATILLNNGAVLQNTNPNHWTVINGAVTVPAGASAIINHTINATAVAGRGFYLDGGLQGTGTVTINAAAAGSGVNFRNNNTNFAGTMIVNGIASAIPFAGSGIGVGGNTSGLINADIQVNGTMELLNQGIGWANGAPGDFFMDALTGTGVMVANYTAAGGQTRVRLGNNNGSGNFSGSIVDGTGNQIIPLTKNGTGTQTFSGTNTYTGNTIVNAGVLQLQNGSAIADAAGAVSVALGATLQLLSNETISSYAGAGDGVGSNDSTLALGNNVLTTTAGASIANVTSGTTGGIVAGTSIVDNDDDNNVTGTGIFLQSASGVGTSANPIETTVSNLEALTVTGGIVVSNTGAVTVGNVTGALGGIDVTTAGDISLTATGSINVSLVNEDVVGPANITINAQGATSDVNTGTAGGFGAGSINGTGPTSLVSVTAGRDVNVGTATLNDYGDIYSNGSILVTAGRDFVLRQSSFLDVYGAGTNTVNAGRDIVLLNDNSNTRLTTQGGLIALTAGRNVVANVQGFILNTIDSTQGGITPAGANVAIVATTGSITIGDGIDAGTAGTVTLAAGAGIADVTPVGGSRVTGLNLVATAATGITGPLETAVTRLEASGGTGGVFVNNTGNLTIGGIGALVGVNATGGDIVVTATGSLTVGENVAATGGGTDVTLTAIDAAAAGQDLVASAGVLISSAAASVTLNAGDNLTVTGNVTSVTTTTMNVDFGNADPGTGGLLGITGIVTTPVVGSGGGAFINGQTDNDTFTFNPQTTTEFRLLGNAPLGTVVGDTLVMNVTGTTNPNLTVPGSLAPYNGLGSGAWSFTSAHRPVLFGSIEQSTITGNYHVTYDNSVAPIGNLIVMRDVGGTNVQLRDGSTAGPIVYQGSLATVLSLRILGSAGNDIVTVDDINTLPNFVGTVPGVTNNTNLAGIAELLFDGQGGNDTLVYNINGADAVQFYAIGNGTGAAGLEGEIDSIVGVISLQTYFQNVELTQRTGVGASPGFLDILGDLSGNSFSTAANGTFTRTSITGYTPFEFSGNNYSDLFNFGLSGNDSIDLISLGTSQTNNPLIGLNGGFGDDTIRVRSTSGNTGLVTMTGVTGSDLFQLFDAGNTVDGIAGPVIVDGTDGNVGGNMDTLVIVDSGDLTADSVLVSAVNPGASQDYAIEGINTVAGNDVTLRNVDVLNYISTSAGDTIDGRFVNTAPLHDLSVVNLSGWTGADQFLLFISDQIGGSGVGFTPSGTASGVASISLFGDAPGNPNAGDLNDTFGATPLGVVGTGVTNVGLVVADTTRMIRPSASTSIAIDGGQPTGLIPPVGDASGDVLNTDISALPNAAPVIVSTFAPGTVVAAGIQPFTWTQIEDMNLVDQGKLTNVQMGDLFARTTPGADLIQVTRNATLLNPNQVRLRINATIGNYSVSNKTIMYGGGLNDTLTQSNLTVPAEFYGEDGDDYLTGAMNNDWLVGGLGHDRINGSGGDNVIWGDNAPTLPSDPNPQDLVVGGNDQLSGLGGADVIYGGGGDDLVTSGGGNDYVQGGQGNDDVGGGDGDDRLYGGLGNDIISGHSGNDIVSGAAGDDFVYGNTGNDVVFGGTGQDAVDGGDGNDLLVSGSVANETSSRTALANTATYSSATYTNGTDNDAALITLLAQWGSASNRSTIGAISHDGVDDDLAGGQGDDDFCWELADIIEDPAAVAPSDFNAVGYGTDERFGPI